MTFLSNRKLGLRGVYFSRETVFPIRNSSRSTSSRVQDLCKNEPISARPSMCTHNSRILAICRGKSDLILIVLQCPDFPERLLQFPDCIFLLGDIQRITDQSRDFAVL
jgi:hypothetical protein